MIKVATFTTLFYPSTAGVSNVITNSIFGLKNKCTFEIYTFHPGPEKYKKYIVHRFKSKRIIDGFTINLDMIQRQLDADLVHIHHFGYFPATAGFISAKINNLPIVFTPYFHPRSGLDIKTLYFWLYNVTQGITILRYSDVVMPTTNYEAKELCKIGGKLDNVIQNFNPVDVKKFKPIKSYKIDNKNVVLYVSNMNDFKGCDKLFAISQKLLKKRKDLLFVFIGRGPLKKELIKKSRKYKNNYLFLENLSEKELNRWYSTADVLVLPSKYESFGMVLAEAMACGTPVIATRVGGIPEVVYDKNLLVDYGDWDKMEKLIEYVIDSGYKEKHKKRIRSYVVKKFSIPVVSNKLYKIYKSLV